MTESMKESMVNLIPRVGVKKMKIEELCTLLSPCDMLGSVQNFIDNDIEDMLMFFHPALTQFLRASLLHARDPEKGCSLILIPKFTSPLYL